MDKNKFLNYSTKVRHKWVNDVCQCCGLIREKRMQKKWQRTIGLLRHGVWEDKHLYTENLRYYYGERFGFDRPDCIQSTSI